MSEHGLSKLGRISSIYITIRNNCRYELWSQMYATPSLDHAVLAYRVFTPLQICIYMISPTREQIQIMKIWYVVVSYSVNICHKHV